MGREIRMVPKAWEHPKNESGRYKGLFDSSYIDELKEYNAEKAYFDAGFDDDGVSKLPAAAKELSFDDWRGGMCDPDMYMPSWPDKEKTHLMMYETTSEGTPISPAFETPEGLAQWLFDNNASSFASRTATYDQWLGVCKGGWAPSAIISSKGIQSGVEALNN